MTVSPNNLTEGTTSIALLLITMGTKALLLFEKSIRNSLHLSSFKRNLSAWDFLVNSSTLSRQMLHYLAGEQHGQGQPLVVVGYQQKPI